MQEASEGRKRYLHTATVRHKIPKMELDLGELYGRQHRRYVSVATAKDHN